MVKRLLLATHNHHKLQEVQEILKPLAIEVVGAEECGLADVEEVGQTFEENALLKARFGFQQTGLATLADDSGLCIRALNDAPGLFSARFAAKNGGYPAVFDVIESSLKGQADRSAYFRCCLAFVNEKGDSFVFNGTVEGEIVSQPEGLGAFGYDPIFRPQGYEHTFGVLPSDVKHRLSHRGRALAAFVAFLEKN